MKSEISMAMFYILEGKTPVPVDSLLDYAEWAYGQDRTVKKTELPGGVMVSTMFLGLFGQMFETMIFGGEHDMYQRQYSTWEEAEKGHQEAIEMIFEA